MTDSHDTTPELNERAAKLLDGGIDIYIAARLNIEYAEGPRYVCAHLDRPTFDALADRLHLCAERRFLMIEDQLQLRTWDEDCETDVGDWTSRNDGLSFWWHGCPNGGMGDAESHTISMKELIEALSAGPEEELPDGWAWYAGTLVYDEGCVEDLVEALQQQPELAARQTEIEMSRAVRDQAGAAALSSANGDRCARRSRRAM